MPHDSVRDRKFATNSAKITREITGKYSHSRFHVSPRLIKKAREAGF